MVNIAETPSKSTQLTHNSAPHSWPKAAHFSPYRKFIKSEAARPSFTGDLEPLTKIIDKAVRPVRSVAVETRPADKALAAHLELAGAYALAAAIDKKTEIDGMTPQQRATVSGRVRQILAQELDAGRIAKTQNREAATDANRAD